MSSPRSFFLLGWPVEHSLSPAIFTAAFAAAGIGARYTALAVRPEELSSRFAELRRAGAEGFNLTLPHKRAVIPLLDEVEAGAARVGAVNAVALRGGRAVGHNTDVAGLMRGLAAAGAPPVAGRSALLLGAGGAARAAVAALAGGGAGKVTVANRSRERAEELCSWARAAWPAVTFAAAGLVPGELPAGASDVRLCLQATSLGLRSADPLPLDPALLPPGCFLYDMVYAPGETALVRAARALGRQAADGRGMLLGQALEAFALWLGLPAPEQAMREALDGGLDPRGSDREVGRSRD